ncbi:hypothetical protein ACC736_37650, partial [Rhizobium ruizarguesonis]
SLIVNIMSSSPRLAEVIAAKPHVFDVMLDPGLMAELPTRDYLGERLKGSLAQARHYEALLGSNPALLSLIVNIMSSSPRLAEVIAAKPHVFD